MKAKDQWRLLKVLKKALKLGVKSVTFDNGTEFTLHYTLTEQHMIDTYFL